MKKKRSIHQSHWYKLYVVECPTCGSVDERRERVYGQKPKDPSKRYDYTQAWDGCNI